MCTRVLLTVMGLLTIIPPTSSFKGYAADRQTEAVPEIMKALKWQVEQMSHFTCDLTETRKFVDQTGITKREISYLNHLKFAFQDPKGYRLVQYNAVENNHEGLYDNGLATLLSVLLLEYKWYPTDKPSMFYVREVGGRTDANTVFQGMALLSEDNQIEQLIGDFTHLSYGIKHLNIVYHLTPTKAHEGIVYLPSLVILSARSKGVFAKTGFNELRLEYGNWKDERLSAPSFEAELFDLINTVRRQNRLPALKYNKSLASEARNHSENIARYGYKESLHVEADGHGFQQRSKHGASKEIVAYSDEQNPVSVLNRWLDSPGHRKAILSQSQETGIGAYEKEGVHFITGWFK